MQGRYNKSVMNQQTKNKIFERFHQEIKENLITKDKACLDMRRLRSELTNKKETLFWHNNDLSKQEQEDLEMFG